MGNMSYCKFRNTLNDLRECINAIEEREQLSEDEHQACSKMITEMTNFLENAGLAESTDDFDETYNTILREMKESDEDDE